MVFTFCMNFALCMIVCEEISVATRRVFAELRLWR